MEALQATCPTGIEIVLRVWEQHRVCLGAVLFSHDASVGRQLKRSFAKGVSCRIRV